MSERAQVLVVDDEPQPRRVTVRLLERAGYAVTEAAAGDEGLRLARELRPDLILLDVVLPDLDGVEVCRRIKADPELARICVILLSGERVDADNVAEGLECGANDYVLRGTSPRELLARIEAGLRIQRIEHKLREQTHKLHERVKELHCLYEIARLVERPGITPPEILRGTAELLPAAWQHPEVACARIVVDDQEYRTANYRADAPGRQSAAIQIHGRPAGSVEVCYLESTPESDEGPFLSEERDLLDAIAERLGRILERHQAELELRASLQREQFLGDIVRNASVAIGLGYLDGSLGMNNPAAQELTGYSAEELQTLNWRTDLTPPEWREHEAAHLQQLHRTRSPVRFEKEYIRKDGTRVPVELVVHPKLDESGNVEGYISFVSDITERQQVLEALRRERDLVASIMETSPVGIVVLDRQGQITFVNAQVEQVTGLAREQIVQLNYNDPTWQMMDETGRPLSNDLLPFPRLMREGKPIYDLQQVVEMPAAAGSGPRRMHLSMNAAPIYDASGAVDGVVVTVQDVTRRVHLEEQVRQHAVELEQRVAERTAELQASQAALLRAERLAIAGKLAASLTHEISNPLQSVIGCLGLAEETLEEGGDAREYLEVALPELRRVSRIVARLRNLGRPPSPVSSRESTDVGELLEQVQALVRKQCRDRDITLEGQVPPDLPNVHVVPDQLQQVFLNLTLNAIEAMPTGTGTGGRIDVRAARTIEPSGVSISFQDSGVGISRDALTRVFDPFYSTKPEGLGLGLSISQEIVQQHGGRIQVESELGQGSTFTVWLPAHP